MNKLLFMTSWEWRCRGSSDSIFLGTNGDRRLAYGELDVKRPWDVEPRGSLEGSNAMGGTVTVPAVKFWGYTDQRNASQNNQTGTQFAEAIKSSPLSGDSAVNLVKGKIRPTKLLLSTQPDFNQSKWEVVKKQTVCDGCWFVMYIINVKHPPLVYSYPVEGRPVVVDWDVNLRTQTVTPSGPDTAKLFDTSQ